MMSKATALTVASRACCNTSSLASGGATARPAAASRLSRHWRAKRRCTGNADTSDDGGGTVAEPSPLAKGGHGGVRGSACLGIFHSRPEAGEVLRRVLEAELVEEFLAAARVLVLRLVAYDPLAPRVRSEADEGGIALVPLGDQLLEVARAPVPHILWGVRLEQLE
eukprot:scaffold111174_cov63-Phaeocystis_antarctica.AAC.2